MLPVKFDKDKLALLTGVRIYEINTSGELHVVHCLTDDGHEQMITFWQPSEEDIRSMIAGKPIASHHFCGKFDGVAAVLYECAPNVNGTHFAAVIQESGDCHIFPIMSHDGAKTAYYALINQFHADQDKEAA